MFEEVDKGPKNSVGCAELLRSPIDFHELRDIRGKDVRKLHPQLTTKSFIGDYGETPGDL